MMTWPTRSRMLRRGLRQPASQAGFVLPTAIFLVVILAALGGYMVTLARTSHVSSGLDIQGTRAYQAARAGIEWAAWRVVDPQNLLPTPTPCPASPTTVTLTGTLAAFNVVVTCRYIPAIDGTTNVAMYEVTSTATSGLPGTVDYVERQIQGTFSK